MQAESTYSGRTKYDDASASQYQERPRRQHAAEMALVDRVFSSIAKGAQVLDLPCGADRVGLHLARSGYDVVCADLSPAMLMLARRAFLTSSVPCPVERQDIEALTYDNRRFDAVLCFRLFHHFPDPSVRQRAGGRVVPGCSSLRNSLLPQSMVTHFAQTSPAARARWPAITKIRDTAERSRGLLYGSWVQTGAGFCPQPADPYAARRAIRAC